MRRWLPDRRGSARSGCAAAALELSSGYRQLLRICATGGAIFFNFVGVFSYVTFPARAAAVRLRHGGPARSSSCSGLLGVIGPWVGKLVDRIGWRNAAIAAVTCATAGSCSPIPRGCRRSPSASRS